MEHGSSVQCSIRNLKEDSASFLWFRQMHEFMLTLDHHNKEAKEEAVTVCRQQCQSKSQLQSKIDEFQRQSLPENREKAISWYTDNCFMHRCTNTILRKENIGQVYALRYIIQLLCQQLKDLHQHFIQRSRRRKRKELQVYRGQYLHSSHIELLKNHLGHLISLDGFVSTSTDKRIAKDFIRDCLQENFLPVLFKINLDLTNMDTVPFADVSAFSKYDEQEVLLSIGSIFWVNSVQCDEELQGFIIELTLARNEQMTVTRYIEETYAKNLGSVDQSVLFGKLLFDMGATDAAVKYFSDTLERLPSDPHRLRPIFLNNLGVCYNELGDKNQALECYQKAMEIYQGKNDKRALGACEHNVNKLFVFF